MKTPAPAPTTLSPSRSKSSSTSSPADFLPTDQTPAEYFFADLSARALPISLEKAIKSMVQTGKGVFRVTSADWQRLDSDLNRYFSRCGPQGLPDYVSGPLTDYLQACGLRFKWEQDERVSGAAHEQRISSITFNFRETASPADRMDNLRAAQEKLLEQKPQIIEGAIGTLSSNFSQNFLIRGNARTQCRELILKGKVLDMTLRKSPDAQVEPSVGVWSSQKRLQFLLGGFERAIGLRLDCVWWGEKGMKVEIRATQTPAELDRSILRVLMRDEFKLMPPQ